MLLKINKQVTHLFETQLRGENELTGYETVNQLQTRKQQLWKQATIVCKWVDSLNPKEEARHLETTTKFMPLQTNEKKFVVKKEVAPAMQGKEY